MFRKKTVFIVGAGASCELGFPLAGELSHQMSGELDMRFGSNGLERGSSRLYGILRQSFEPDEVNKYCKWARQLARSLPLSVSPDQALHYYSSESKAVMLGKLAIIDRILAAEHDCSVLANPQFSPSEPIQIQYFWLTTFLSMAMSLRTREQFTEFFNNVSIINFNYDRVIERYLFLALQGSAVLNVNEAQQSISGLKILRPYGTVGPLEWQREGNSTPIEFGSNDGRVFLSAVNSLQTYAEGVREGDVLNSIRETMRTAEVTIFLGFGYSQPNMALLASPDANSSNQVFATAYGIDKENYDLISRSIATMVRTPLDNVRLLPLKAHQLMENLRPSIMAAVS